MSSVAANAIYWDPYRMDIALDPYPTYKRMRDELPLYYNQEHDFYAVSRYADVERCFKDRESLSSARGDILEIVKANLQLPEAVFINQDPPAHTAFRSLMQRIITPKRMNAVEHKIRELCVRSLDPLVGTDRFDFIANLGAEVPMRAIGMLLGIPEEDQAAIRDSVDERLRIDDGKPMAFAMEHFTGELGLFEDYINWREKHPSDDMMTELLQAEFTDPKGVVRRLRRDEVLAIVNVVAGAGNETTNRLIGWMGKTLAEHPDQRRELAANPALIPQAIEELLRFEPPGPNVARYVARDIEFYGKTIPAGSAMMLLVGAANRDERRFVNGDAFDIHRESRPHLGFGHGIHVCLGAPLARLEGRVAMEEVLKRFTDWEVDYAHCQLSATSSVRGWDALPVFVGGSRKAASPPSRPASAAEPAAAAAVTLEGTWNLVVKSPTGPMPAVLLLERNGDGYTGTQSGQGNSTAVSDFKVNGNKLSWVNHVTSPMKIKVEFSGELSGNTLSGKAKAGFMGSFAFTGTKA